MIPTVLAFTVDLCFSNATSTASMPNDLRKEFCAEARTLGARSLGDFSLGCKYPLNGASFMPNLVPVPFS